MKRREAECKNSKHSSNDMAKKEPECYNCHKRYIVQTRRVMRQVKTLILKDKYVDVVVVSNNYEFLRVLTTSISDTYTFLVKEFFETLELKEGGVVLLGNNKIYKMQGMRLVNMKMFDNQEMLQGVRYVSDLKRNLLLISLFNLAGLTTKIEQGTINILKRVSIIVKGLKRLFNINHVCLWLVRLLITFIFIIF